MAAGDNLPHRKARQTAWLTVWFCIRVAPLYPQLTLKINFTSKDYLRAFFRAFRHTHLARPLVSGNGDPPPSSDRQSPPRASQDRLVLRGCKGWRGTEIGQGKVWSCFLPGRVSSPSELHGIGTPTWTRRPVETSQEPHRPWTRASSRRKSQRKWAKSIILILYFI